MKTAATIQHVIAGLSSVQSITVEHANKLIGILEAANNEALTLLYRNRVRFCWAIARRILRDRGLEVA